MDWTSARTNLKLRVKKHLEHGWTGFVFQTLPEKGLVEKFRRCKGGRKFKKRLTGAFFLAADGSKISEQVVIWKGKSPRCFKTIRAKLDQVWYITSQMKWLGWELK